MDKIRFGGADFVYKNFSPFQTSHIRVAEFGFAPKFQGYAYHYIFQCTFAYARDLGSGLYHLPNFHLEFRHLVSTHLSVFLTEFSSGLSFPLKVEEDFSEFDEFALANYSTRGPPILSLASYYYSTPQYLILYTHKYSIQAVSLSTIPL